MFSTHAKRNINSIDNSLLRGQTDIGTINDCPLVSWWPAQLQSLLCTKLLNWKYLVHGTRAPEQAEIVYFVLYKLAQFPSEITVGTRINRLMCTILTNLSQLTVSSPGLHQPVSEYFGGKFAV